MAVRYQAKPYLAGLKIHLTLNLFPSQAGLDHDLGDTIRDMIAIALAAGCERGKRNH